MSRGVIIFWLLALGLIALDLQHSPYGYRVEPPPWLWAAVRRQAVATALADKENRRCRFSQS